MIRAATVADAEAIARVHVATWRRAYEGVLPADYLARLSAEQRLAGWLQALQDAKQQTFVFEAGGELVGFCNAGPNRGQSLGYAGEVYALYILPEAWRSGTGGRLLTTSVEWLWSRGYESVLVWVLNENRPARGFYQRFGGEIVGEKSVSLAGEPRVEVAYGWKDKSAWPGRARTGAY